MNVMPLLLFSSLTLLVAASEIPITWLYGDAATRHRGKDYTQLMKYLSRYAAMDCPLVTEISLVWNNEDSPGEAGALAQAEEWKRPVRFYIPPKKSMDERYRAHPKSNAEVYFSLDDQVDISCQQMTRGFEEWRKRAVGNIAPLISFQGRIFEYQATRGYLVPRFKGDGMFGFVLSGATFISRHFLDLYYGRGSPELTAMREIIQSYNNCEDIGMSWLVSYYYPELLPLVIKGEFKIDPCPVARSHKPVHTAHRTDCLTNFTKIFGVNPLRYSHPESTHPPAPSLLQRIIPIKRDYIEQNIIKDLGDIDLKVDSEAAQAKEKEERQAEKQGSQTSSSALQSYQQTSSYLYQRNKDLTRNNELLKHELQEVKKGPTTEEFVEFVRQELLEEKRWNYMRSYLELAMAVTIIMLGWLLCVQSSLREEEGKRGYAIVPSAVSQ